jgi:hypothetical protein
MKTILVPRASRLMAPQAAEKPWNEDVMKTSSLQTTDDMSDRTSDV